MTGEEVNVIKKEYHSPTKEDDVGDNTITNIQYINGTITGSAVQLRERPQTTSKKNT